MSPNLRDTIRKELIKNREYTKFSDDYKFYVHDICENLIGGKMSDEHKMMFDEASGSELKDRFVPAKAKAIDSSSILSYNFFRHVNEKCTIEIDGVTYNKVFFEVQLKTLPESNKPANIDVALVSKDEKKVLFIESKFLEFLELGSDKLSDSYKDIKKFYNDNEEIKDLFEMSKKFTSEKKRYNYGIKQNICHLIGISNLNKSKTAKEWFEKKYKDSPTVKILNADSYRFMNIIFSPSNEKAKEMCKAYIDHLSSFQESLPDNMKQYIGETFIMTYRKLYDIIPVEKDVKEELFKRYIDFHS